MPGADFDWTHVISVLFGGGGATFFVRVFTKRAIDQLDHVINKLESCTTKLLLIENELKNLQPLRDMVLNHDRKIVEIDVRSSRLYCQLKDVNPNK